MILRWIIFFLISTLSIHPLISQCELDSVTLDFGDCHQGKIDAWIDFLPPTLHSGQFVIRGNGVVYGTFSYKDLPVKLESISVQASMQYEFVIQDVEIDTCQYVINYGELRCESTECDIKEMIAESIDSCYSGYHYAVVVDFESTGFESFDLYVNGVFYNYFQVGQLPLLIHDFPASGDKYDVIKIYANDREDCYQITEVMAPPCANPCTFSELEAKVVECDGDSFYVKLDLEHNGEAEDTFQVKGNGKDYGLFRYKDLPILLGPFDLGQYLVFEFLLQDINNPDCQVEASLEGDPCRQACFFGEVKGHISRCDSATFDLVVDFPYEGDFSDSFRIQGNGRLYGIFAYTDLPVTLKDLTADGHSKFEFKIKDQHYDDCHSFFQFGPIDCRCVLLDLEVDAGDCTSDTTYLLEVDFRTELSDTFELHTGNLLLGTFQTNELPLRLPAFPASGKSIDVLKLCMPLDSVCCIPIEIDAPQCAVDDCNLSGLQVSTLECHDEKFYIKIDFEWQGLSGDYFIMAVNGKVHGRYAYGDLPVRVGPFKTGDLSVIRLEVFDAEQESCRLATEIEPIDCSCELDEIDVEVGTCTSDSTYQIELDLDIDNDFDLFVNGHYCGTFNGDQLPLTFDDFPASGQPYDYIKICQNDQDGCCREKKVEAPVCALRSCGFENVEYELTDCDTANQFYVLLNFDTVGVHSETFIVQQGDQYFEFPYSSKPVRVGPFSGGEFYKLKICDGLWHDCHTDVVLGRVICEAECDFGGAVARFDECVSDEAYILVIDSVKTDFKAFDIYYGDKGLGFYKKSDLPLRLKVPVPDDDFALLRFCVSDNTTCCYEIEIPIPDCEQECTLTELVLDSLACRGDSVWFNLSFDDTDPLDWTHYIIKVNGEEFRNDHYNASSIHLGPLPAGEKAVYEIVVKSTLNPECQGVLRIDEAVCPNSAETFGGKLLILESVENRVYVRVPDFIEERTDFVLVDLSGRILHQVTFSTSNYRAVLRTPVISPGMYILKMRSAKGEDFVSKVIMP